MPGYPAPDQGYKIHVSARAEDAEIVACSVLPVLRRLRVAHKVVRNLDRYRQQLAGPQRIRLPITYPSLVYAARLASNAMANALTFCIPSQIALGPG